MKKLLTTAAITAVASSVAFGLGEDIRFGAGAGLKDSVLGTQNFAKVGIHNNIFDADVRFGMSSMEVEGSTVDSDATLIGVSAGLKRVYNGTAFTTGVSYYTQSDYIFLSQVSGDTTQLGIYVGVQQPLNDNVVLDARTYVYDYAEFEADNNGGTVEYSSFFNSFSLTATYLF